MFSFVGDVVLDPFAGTGTTTLAAAQWGRNSISLEVDPQYHKFAQRRIREAIAGLFRTATLSTAGD
jgi:DNA modification methylase